MRDAAMRKHSQVIPTEAEAKTSPTEAEAKMSIVVQMQSGALER